jgi:hypothetical protein
MAKKYDGSDANPMIVKDIKVVEKTSTGFKELAHRFSKEHKVTRAQEKLQAKLAEKQLAEQKEETKKLVQSQDSLNQSMSDMQRTAGDGQRSNEEHLKMVRQAFGNFSKEAKDTQAEMKLQGDKFEPNNEKNMVQNTDMMVKFQERQLEQAKNIDEAKQQEETYQKTIDAEKRREAGVGQKLILGSLKKMGGYMKGMFDSTMKVATTGIKGAFIALGIMALLEFLESETWKNLKQKMTEWMPKMQGFYDYLFKEETGLFPRIGKIFDYFKDDKTGEFDFLGGLKKVWDKFSGIELLIGGLALALILPKTLSLLVFKGAWKLVTGALGLTMKLFRGLASLIKGDTKKLAKKVPTKPTVVDKVKKATTSVKETAKKVGTKVSTATTAAKTAVTSAGAKVATTAGAMSQAGAQKVSAMKSAVGKLAHLKKYPGLLKAAKRIPLLGPILSGAMVAQLLLSDASHEEKVKGIGGIIGGGLGSAGFGMVGAAMGSVFPGPGTVIGGILGSLGGWFGGEWLGTKLAGFLMGDKAAKIDKPNVPKGKGGPPPKMGMSPGHPSQVKPTPAVVGGSEPDSTAAAQMSANASANDALRRTQGDTAGGGDTMAVAAPTTQQTTNNTTVMSDSATPTDRRLMSLNHNWVPGSY